MNGEVISEMSMALISSSEGLAVHGNFERNGAHSSVPGAPGCAPGQLCVFLPAPGWSLLADYPLLPLPAAS